MKHFIYPAMAIAILFTACNSTPTDQDYIDAFAAYKATQECPVANITIEKVQDITVADSLEYYREELTTVYNNILNDMKTAWEKKLDDCEKDELANKLRHEDYMKKYNEAKRRYGNDIKYKNKIEGYLKAAQKLPATHEEYLKFDRSRSYSFTRDAEQLEAEYYLFAEKGAEQFIAEHQLTAQYNERSKDEILGVIYLVTYNYETSEEQLKEKYLFDNAPVQVISIITEAAD